ncbi:MAG: hypothetical protein V7742_14040 [Halioglobus sp.]
MEEILELDIAKAALRNGHCQTDPNKCSSRYKEIELTCGIGSGRKYVYISRTTHLKKGLLRLAVSANAHTIGQVELLAIEGVECLVNQQTKLQALRSSNFYGFDNKSKSGSHEGYGYLVPANDGLIAFEKVLAVLRK